MEILPDVKESMKNDTTVEISFVLPNKIEPREDYDITKGIMIST